ncbi:hypothetical protein OYC64_016996 [Pagothenia borchgrevinki]|uniref:Secreted protein n=1 Tax=Pagothenia borchgrevinki TaxID=8213 RepID=A0ABD2HLG3_PAGBO
MTGWVKHKPVRRQTAVAPPKANALWLLVTIVPLCSQALTSGDNGHGGKEEREPGPQTAVSAAPLEVWHRTPPPATRLYPVSLMWEAAKLARRALRQCVSSAN